MMSHPLYSWQHTHSLWHHILYTCDITATVSMTRHPLYLWHHSIYDISQGVGMTIQPRYPTSHSQYLCNHTHLIDDITPYVCLKSYPLHVGHHRHYLWHHILIPLFVCYGTHYVYDIISNIYDVTHTVCMRTQALYMTWNPFYLPSYLLYISSHPLSRRHHTNNVRDHRWHMYAIMCTIHDNISTRYDNNP